MKIPKAREILPGIRKALTGEEHDALKLGEEALKRIESCRTGNAANVELPLPGETMEEEWKHKRH